MKKQLIRTSINKNGDVRSRNVLFSSKHLQGCINYFENGGIK